MRAARRLAGLLLLSIAACGNRQTGSAPAAPPALARTPDWKVDRNRLESALLNFRLVGPEGWAWSEDTAQRSAADQQFSFVVRRDEGRFFRVVVRRRGLFENSARSIQQYLQGIAEGNLSAGTRVSDVASQPLRTPAGAGYAYVYRMQLAQGANAFADGYVLAADRFYIIQYISADRSELAAFEKTVGSFELLVTPAPTPPAAN